MHESHRASGARLVEFAGWQMPLHFGSQIDEHHAVRRAAGMFDVSHMCVIDVLGPGARDFLRHALANDVAKLHGPGHALYSCLLNEHGGVIDDLVVFAIDARAYRLVVNAGTASQDIEWLQRIANARGPGTDVVPRTDLAILAVQGPLARARVWQAFPELQADTAGLPRFHGTFVRDWFLARTGYTGEDGFEIMLPAPLAARTWALLARAGVQPCGLGARDTLRLEAGLNLYGHDLDASTSPLESGLAWTVDRSSDRDFLGRAALATPARSRVGLVLLDPGVLRAGQTVCTRHGAGVTTSGSFAPTLGRSIALARVPAAVQPGDTVEVEIRGKRQRARVVTTPFVRDGKTLTDRTLQ